MRCRSVASLAALVVATACASAPAAPRTTHDAPPPPEPRTLDDFEDVSAWQAAPASGVALQLSADTGFEGGSALRIDFDFQGGGGWAALRRALPVRLPENYELSFRLRADAPENTLEFKLIDASGENVWWVNRPRFAFAGDWRRVSFRRRHVTFAWGPAGGGEIRDVAAIELAITAGTGGAGTVWIDDLTLTPLEPVRPYDLTPVASASSTAPDTRAGAVIDADTASVWRSALGGRQVVRLDFGRTREYGGLVVHWDEAQRALDYDVDVSADGAAWQTVRRVRGGGGARDWLLLPETESRWLRLRLLRGADPRAYAIRSLDVQPIEWGESRNTLFEAVAADARRGEYPRYLLRTQSYWTVVGVNGDGKEALISEDGAIEPDVGSLSLEPFLFQDGRLLSWADARITQSLEQGALPIPSVRRDHGDLVLTTTAWADGEPGSSILWARYRVENTGARARDVRLFLALRPFQVNPTWQFLNNPGGSAIVRSIGRYADGAIRVNDDPAIGTGDLALRVLPVTPPDGFGAATFDGGGVIRWLRAGDLPPDPVVVDGVTPAPASLTPASATLLDGFAAASGALAWDLALAPGVVRDVYVAVPFHPVVELEEGEEALLLADDEPPVAVAIADSLGAASLRRAVAGWARTLGGFDVALPPGAPPLGALVRSNVAYVLINRDGPAIQPGSRSYQRSWIRDGALTSAALLRMGLFDVVRAFAEWYAPYQYDDGKVPCCVDRSGAGPVPENDSHGQLIYLIAEYHRFTGDDAFLARMWPHVEAAVAYMDSLRQSRMTPVYETADSAAYYGLLPQSISHEGYAAKPMHSYWDQFFALTGFKDAVYVAERLGRAEEARRFAALRDAFERDLVASFERAMAMHGIDYLPGAVELGDFDATSTTVGVTPAGAADVLPDGALHATFDRYWRNFEARASGAEPWDAYTPYELRTVGTFVRLGQRERAHRALAWFMEHLRPRAWNHWAEVVTRDAREPRFLGDMPHTWVGSDFIRAVTDMFAYVDEADGALVLAAGVLPAWLDAGGLRVRGLHTPFGVLGYAMQRTGTDVMITFDDGAVAAARGIVVRSPLEQPVRAYTVDGVAHARGGSEIVLERLPRRLVLHY